MNSDYPFINKCVKWSKMKMSRLNIRNEPVWLKNIRLGTQAIEILHGSSWNVMSLLLVFFVFLVWS